MKKSIALYICIASFIAMILSIYITINQFSPIDSCFQAGGCAIVDASRFSRINIIPLSIVGIFIFIFIFLLLLWQMKKPTKNKENIISVVLILTSFFALYLIYLQFFVINAICQYCLIIDFLVLTMLIAWLFRG